MFTLNNILFTITICLIPSIVYTENQIKIHQSSLSLSISYMVKICDIIFRNNELKIVIPTFTDDLIFQSAIIQTLSNRSVILRTADTKKTNKILSASNYLIFIDCYTNPLETVKNIVHNVKHISNSNAQMLILFTNNNNVDDNNSRKIDIQIIFNKLLTHNFYNVHIIQWVKKSIYISTYEHFNCVKKNLINQIKTFKILNFIEIENLFEKRLNYQIDNNNMKMKKCPMKILIRILEPYVFNRKSHIDGIDIELLEFVLEGLNMFPIYYYMNNTITTTEKTQIFYKDLIDG